MSLSEGLPEHGISPANLQLLRWCFAEIPAGGEIDRYSFSERELEEYIQQVQETLDAGPTNRPWKTYFNNTDSSSWTIDEEEIVQGWCATLQETHDVDIREINSDPVGLSSYNVSIDTANRGEVKLELFFKTENLLKSLPQPAESKFLIWFLEPRSGDDRDCVYPWYRANKDQFWNQIIKQLIEHQRAPDESICQLNSHAVRQNFDGVKDSVKIISEHHGATIRTQPHLIDNIQQADAELIINQIDFAVEISDGTHLTVCECSDVGSETLHTHLVVNGETRKPKSNPVSEVIINDSHAKVRRYNDLFDDRESSSRFIKLAVGMLGIGALPALSNLVNVFSGSTASQISLIYGSLGVIVILLAILFFAYTILPLIRLRRFSWDSPKTTDALGRTLSFLSSHKPTIAALL